MQHQPMQPVAPVQNGQQFLPTQPTQPAQVTQMVDQMQPQYPVQPGNPMEMPMQPASPTLLEQPVHLPMQSVQPPMQSMQPPIQSVQPAQQPQSPQPPQGAPDEGGQKFSWKKAAALQASVEANLKREPEPSRGISPPAGDPYATREITPDAMMAQMQAPPAVDLAAAPAHPPASMTLPSAFATAPVGGQAAPYSSDALLEDASTALRKLQAQASESPKGVAEALVHEPGTPLAMDPPKVPPSTPTGYADHQRFGFTSPTAMHSPSVAQGKIGNNLPLIDEAIVPGVIYEAPAPGGQIGTAALGASLM